MFYCIVLCDITSIIFQFVTCHVHFLFMTCSEGCVLSSGDIIIILMLVTSHTLHYMRMLSFVGGYA
jgi:hypothetical protein